MQKKIKKKRFSRVINSFDGLIMRENLFFFWIFLCSRDHFFLKIEKPQMKKEISWKCVCSCKRLLCAPQMQCFCSHALKRMPQKFSKSPLFSSSSSHFFSFSLSGWFFPFLACRQHLFVSRCRDVSDR